MIENLYGNNNGNGHYGFDSAHYNKRMNEVAQQNRFAALQQAYPNSDAYTKFDPKADYYSGKAEADFRAKNPTYDAQQKENERLKVIDEKRLHEETHRTQNQARFRTLHELDPKKYPSGTFDPKKDYMAGEDLAFYEQHKAEYLNPKSRTTSNNRKSLRDSHAAADHSHAENAETTHHHAAKHGKHRDNGHNHHKDNLSHQVTNAAHNAANTVRNLLHLGR